MNKYFELSKITGAVSLVTAILYAGIYISFTNTEVGTYQLTDGREEIAASIFKIHQPDLIIAYSLFAVTCFLVLLTAYFGYRGFKSSK